MTIADDQSTEMLPDVLELFYGRRRPGPRPDIQPDLLPTYRGIVPEDADDDDPLNPARGVLLGLILAVQWWGVVVAAVWWLVG